jgi:iron(III) transport system substrate-binding protein
MGAASVRWHWPLVAAATSAALTGMAQAQVPEGYPSDYATIVAAAKAEGSLTIAAAIDRNAAEPLLRDFRDLYPAIEVTLLDFSSTHLTGHFLGEIGAGKGTSDVLLSSDMGMQIELANMGMALPYATPEIPALPAWAVWRRQAYGVTYEPVTIVYNKGLVPEPEVPHDHAALLDVLTRRPDAYRGKIAAYDPARLGAGFLLATQDVANWQRAWELFDAFGRAEIKLYTGAGEMVDRVASGEHVVAYGVFGSYALTRARADPNLGVVMPGDYTLVASRVMFIPRLAKHPNAAKLFLDYVLSKRGQTIIATKARLYALRSDIDGEATIKTVSAMIGDRARPIPINATLLASLSPMKRREFFERWRAAMQPP